MWSWLKAAFQKPERKDHWPYLQVTPSGGWVFDEQSHQFRRGTSRLWIWTEAISLAGSSPKPSLEDLLAIAITIGSTQRLGPAIGEATGKCRLGQFAEAQFHQGERFSRIWCLSNGLDFVLAKLEGPSPDESAAAVVLSAQFRGQLSEAETRQIPGFGTLHPEPRMQISLPSHWQEVSQTDNREGGPTFRPSDQPQGALQLSLERRFEPPYQDFSVMLEALVQHQGLGEIREARSGASRLGQWAALKVGQRQHTTLVMFTGNRQELVLATVTRFWPGTEAWSEAQEIVRQLQLRPPYWSPLIVN